MLASSNTELALNTRAAVVKAVLRTFSVLLEANICLSCVKHLPVLCKYDQPCSSSFNIGATCHALHYLLNDCIDSHKTNSAAAAAAAAAARLVFMECF